MSSSYSTSFLMLGMIFFFFNLRYSDRCIVFLKVFQWYCWPGNKYLHGFLHMEILALYVMISFLFQTCFVVCIWHIFLGGFGISFLIFLNSFGVSLVSFHWARKGFLSFCGDVNIQTTSQQSYILTQLQFQIPLRFLLLVISKAYLQAWPQSNN